MLRGILALIVAVMTQTAPQQPVFKAGVDQLRVDVQVVTSDGHPIPNLGVADFSVMIDGRPRRVVSAEIVRYGQGPTDPAISGVAIRSPGQIPEDARLYVLAVDQLGFTAGAIMPIRNAVRRFIDQLRPEDMVGLYDFPFRIPALDLTHDHTAVSRAFERLLGLSERGQGQFNLSPSEIVDITADDPDTFNRVVRRECEPDDGACPLLVRGEAAGLAGFHEGENQQRLNALSNLILGLSRVPGRKTVLLVSGGMLSSTRSSGRPDVTSLMSRVGEEAAAADTNLYVMHWDTTFIDTYSASASRPSRSPADRFQSQFADRHALGAGLEWIAGKAGGALLRIEAGTGDRAFDRVLRETESYYLLGVEPADADRDGQPHVLRVSVSQRGATVRARSQNPDPETKGVSARPSFLSSTRIASSSCVSLPAPDSPSGRVHRHIHRPRMHLHVLAVGGLHAHARQPERRSIEEPHVPRVDDPPRGRLAHDGPQLQRAIAFREVLGIRERVLVGDEHRRRLERPLAENRAGRRFGHDARGHAQVRLPGEHVDRVRVHEAAVVVSNVDHDAVELVILDVQIDVELVERRRAHVDHVDVAEPAAARLQHVLAIGLDPPRDTAGSSRSPGWSDGRPPRRGACPVVSTLSTTRRSMLFARRSSRFVRARHRLPVDGHDRIAGGDAAGERRRTERHHAADAQAARRFVRSPIEAKAETANRLTRLPAEARRPGGTRSSRRSSG